MKKLQKGIKCFQILMERCVFNNKVEFSKEINAR